MDELARPQYKVELARGIVSCSASAMRESRNRSRACCTCLMSENMASSSSISSEEVVLDEPDSLSGSADRPFCTEFDLGSDLNVDSGDGRELMENPLRVNPTRLVCDSLELMVETAANKKRDARNQESPRDWYKTFGNSHSRYTVLNPAHCGCTRCSISFACVSAIKDEICYRRAYPKGCIWNNRWPEFLSISLATSHSVGCKWKKNSQR